MYHMHFIIKLQVFLLLQQIAYSFILVNDQDEQAMPAVDVPAYMADKMAKAASAFALNNYDVFYIYLYRFISP